MAILRNKQSFLSLFSGLDTNLRSFFIDQPKAYMQQTRAKLRDLPRTNFDLGCDFADRGQWQDAAFRFRVAIYLQPNFAQAHYNLGCCLLRLKQPAKAKQSLLNALKLVPNHADALFMLSAIDPNAVAVDRRPQRMPVPMMLQFFGQLSSVYESVEAGNNYQGGRVVFDVVRPLLQKTQDLMVVDLGSGTGLSSRPWRSVAKEIVGVEMVPAMAQVAREIRAGEAALFDRVLEEDILLTDHLPLAEVDVVLVVNVAQFLGNLQSLFAALGAKLKPGALAAITIEPFSVAAGFGVNMETGRFGHHPDYIKRGVEQVGLSVKKDARVQLYPNFPAHVFVVGK